MIYLIRRGKRAVAGRARAHLARYDSFGQIIGPWCHRSGFDLNINLPMGLAICKDCKRRVGGAA